MTSLSRGYSVENYLNQIKKPPPIEEFEEEEPIPKEKEYMKP